MRLVIDGRRLSADRTGVGRYLELLLREWAITGAPLPETLVVLRDRTGLPLVPEAGGIKAEVVGEGWPGLIWEQFALGRRLRPDDILFAPANLIPWGWKGKTILAMHDTLQEVLPDSFPWHARLRFAGRYRDSAERADRVLALSKATKRDISNFYHVPDARLRLVYPAPDRSFRPQSPISDEVQSARAEVGVGRDPFFLFVGKPSGRRNLDAILSAFRLHQGRHPGHRLVFVGPGDPRAEGDSIVKAGHVPEATLRGLLADAQALLYPSEYEGFGLPIVEAMASGCPVITLRRPPLVEAGGDAAWYLDQPEPEAMAEAMGVLATDVATRATRMSRGFLQAAQFPAGKFADEVKAQIRDVAGLRPAAPPRPKSLRRGRDARARR
jgi:glycosyltransferase involved in cell wall biosynthesis